MGCLSCGHWSHRGGLDKTNIAWWSGQWSGRGLGMHVMSQPVREFVIKIVELSLWSGDLLLGHFLLFMLTPPILIPYFDRFHSTILCKLSYESFAKFFLLIHITILVWLRPSKQIRAPLYSLAQKRQRRRIVSCGES
jgi:1,3-beta-glucan synthase